MRDTRERKVDAGDENTRRTLRKKRVDFEKHDTSTVQSSSLTNELTNTHIEEFLTMVSIGQLQMVRFFLSKLPQLANVRSPSSSMSPLHCAAKRRDVEMIGLLLAYNANVRALTIDLLRPVDLVVAHPCASSQDDANIQSIRCTLVHGRHISSIDKQRDEALSASHTREGNIPRTCTTSTKITEPEIIVQDIILPLINEWIPTSQFASESKQLPTTYMHTATRIRRGQLRFRDAIDDSIHQNREVDLVSVKVHINKQDVLILWMFRNHISDYSRLFRDYVERYIPLIPSHFFVVKRPAAQSPYLEKESENTTIQMFRMIEEMLLTHNMMMVYFDDDLILSFAFMYYVDNVVVTVDRSTFFKFMTKNGVYELLLKYARLNSELQQWWNTAKAYYRTFETHTIETDSGFKTDP